MTDHPEASNKARAISRGADLVAAYASDPRGWDGPMTGAQVFGAVAPDTDDGGDLVSIIKDAIADLLHLADHLRMDTNALENMARRHYLGEQGGDLDTAWRAVPESQVEYVPAIASSPRQPMIVVVRHPDWATVETLHYVEADVVDIDLGGSFDITAMNRADKETAREYAADLRKQVEHLPLDHTGRVDVIEQAEYIEEAIA